MKSLRKFTLLALLPTIAFTTSCGYGNKVSFVDAYDYVLKNYDKHQLDYYSVNYHLNDKALKVDGSLTSVNFDGKESRDYHHNLNGITAVLKNETGICISSEVLSEVQNIYTKYFGVTIASVTGISATLDYYLKNGSLTMVLSTDALKSLVGFVQAVYSLMQIPAVRSIILLALGLDENIEKIINHVLDKYSFSPDSIADGYIKVFLSTDNEGFISNFGINANINYDLGFGIYKSIDEEETEDPKYVFSSYLEAKGNFNADISVNVSFN